MNWLDYVPEENWQISADGYGTTLPLRMCWLLPTHVGDGLDSYIFRVEDLAPGHRCCCCCCCCCCSLLLLLLLLNPAALQMVNCNDVFPRSNITFYYPL